MIRCYCFEGRLDRSLKDCDGSPDFCDRCLACEVHSTCPNTPVILRFGKASLQDFATSLPATGALIAVPRTSG
jgi:hypothetical protein